MEPNDTEHPQKKKSLVEVITSALLLEALWEIIKAALAFFVGLLLKKWWDRRSKRKEQEPPQNA